MAKKLTPQQLVVKQQKAIAKNTNIENLLMDAETIKQKIVKQRTAWDDSDKVFRKNIDALEKDHNIAKRLIRYKRDQIIAKTK